MTAVNYAELALIELEYSAADHSDRQSATSDPSERADLTLRLPNIRMAIAAIRFALDAMQVAFDLEAMARPASLASEASAETHRSRFAIRVAVSNPTARPVLFGIITVTVHFIDNCQIRKMRCQRNSARRWAAAGTCLACSCVWRNNGRWQPFYPRLAILGMRAAVVCRSLPSPGEPPLCWGRAPTKRAPVAGSSPAEPARPRS